MKYISTHGESKKYTFTETLLLSVADDGGLFYPETIPVVESKMLESWKDLSYVDLCTEILDLYIGEECVSKEKLHEIVKKSYSEFRAKEVVPVEKVGDIYVSEFFHGPTYSSKDFSMQFLGNYLDYIVSTGYLKQGEISKIITVVIASASNSGPACMAGMENSSELCACYTLYPSKEIQRLKEREMNSYLGTSISSVSLSDVTTSNLLFSLRRMCESRPFAGYQYFVCANALNWFRVLLEIPMFFYSYLQTRYHQDISDSVSISIPTSNLTSVMAGILAKEMRLPFHKLIVACSENDSFIDFVKTGVYKTDLLYDKDSENPTKHGIVQFNFCRILYFLLGSGELIQNMIAESDEQIITDYSISPQLIQEKLPYLIVKEVTNQQSISMIAKYEQQSNYFLCPYSAQAVYAGEQYQASLLSTAEKEVLVCHTISHPGKYPKHMANVLSSPPGNLVPAYIRNLINTSTRKYIMKFDYDRLTKFLFSSSWDAMKQYLH